MELYLEEQEEKERQKELVSPAFLCTVCVLWPRARHHVPRDAPRDVHARCCLGASRGRRFVRWPARVGSRSCRIVVLSVPRQSSACVRPCVAAHVSHLFFLFLFCLGNNLPNYQICRVTEGVG